MNEVLKQLYTYNARAIAVDNWTFCRIAYSLQDGCLHRICSPDNQHAKLEMCKELFSCYASHDGEQDGGGNHPRASGLY